jgi:hypothetical protein
MEMLFMLDLKHMYNIMRISRYTKMIISMSVHLSFSIDLICWNEESNTIEMNSERIFPLYQNVYARQRGIKVLLNTDLVSEVDKKKFFLVRFHSRESSKLSKMSL